LRRLRWPCRRPWRQYRAAGESAALSLVSPGRWVPSRRAPCARPGAL
jgi:hypothetical protein